jgi:hypothetical protein
LQEGIGSFIASLWQRGDFCATPASCASYRSRSFHSARNELISHPEINRVAGALHNSFGAVIVKDSGEFLDEEQPAGKR